MIVYKCDTYLSLIDVVGNMGVVLGLRNIGSPSWHEFNVFEISCLAFKLEVGIDGNIERVQKSVCR